MPDFFGNFSKIPPPQGAKRPGGAAEGGDRGIFEKFLKRLGPRGPGEAGGPGRGILGDAILNRIILNFGGPLFYGDLNS